MEEQVPGAVGHVHLREREVVFVLRADHQQYAVRSRINALVGEVHNALATAQIYVVNAVNQSRRPRQHIIGAAVRACAVARIARPIIRVREERAGDIDVVLFGGTGVAGGVNGPGADAIRPVGVGNHGGDRVGVRGLARQAVRGGVGAPILRHGGHHDAISKLANGRRPGLDAVIRTVVGADTEIVDGEAKGHDAVGVILHVRVAQVGRAPAWYLRHGQHAGGNVMIDVVGQPRGHARAEDREQHGQQVNPET